MTHALKTWPESFQDIKAGIKTFELRKNDRDFKVGDYLLLQEYEPATENYTREEIKVRITYILHKGKDFGLLDGYVILGIDDAY